MTVSAVSSLTLSLNELIAESFDVIGVGSEGEAVTDDMYRRGKQSLNLMLLTLNADEDLWRRETRSVTLIADTASYALASPKPMRVEAARRKVTASGYETPMTMWSRQEYLDQPNKTSTSATPVNFYYDPQRDTGTLYVWPAPASAVASTMTVQLDILRPMFLMNASNDTLDLPQEWQETIVYNLATRLMTKYPVNDPSIGSLVVARAAALMAQLKSWDQEQASIFLQPEPRWGQWR